MNDNDIIKALECCMLGECAPDKCPYFDVRDCSRKNGGDILDIIKRQKAEIDRLNHIRAELSKEIDHLRESSKMARDTAIREFAEKVREKLGWTTE